MKSRNRPKEKVLVTVIESLQVSSDADIEILLRSHIDNSALGSRTLAFP